jgi:glycosyltransferase involved in cell wall biosynthesis
MKTIQFIARVNKGGTAVWLNNLILGLREEGIETLLVAGHISVGEIEAESFLELGGIRINSLGRSINPLLDFQAIIEFRNIIKCEFPDIVNTHTAKAGLIGKLVRLSLPRSKYKFKLIHTYHGHLLYGYFRPTFMKLIKFLERLLSNRVDLYIVPGQTVRDELVSENIGDRGKYRIIFPGVKDFDFPKKSDARKLLKISEDALVVGWLGRIVEVKNPNKVIEIAKKIPNAFFVIGGSGERDLEEYLQSIAPPNVIFAGWVEAQVLWASSDIALLTSINEAQPIALIEAGFASIPAVAENVGAVCEVIEDQKNGILVKSLEESILAVNRLLTDEELRLGMGKFARTMAGSKYSVSKFVSSHIECYKEISRPYLRT